MRRGQAVQLQFAICFDELQLIKNTATGKVLVADGCQLFADYAFHEILKVACKIAWHQAEIE